MDPDRWRLARQLFEEVHALPRGERDVRLAERCGGDARLEHEVRSLLAAHEASEPGVLDRLSARIPSLSEALDDEPPERVGPYEILGEAGRGGMGVVYRAHDARLRRDVALKFLPRFLVRDEPAKARFLAEARAASALDHPGICTIHDVGTTPDGRMYIAMAWYGGGTLADRLSEGPLPVTDAVRIATRVADALDRAHRAGIVHRDVKPANIAFADDGVVKVLDFGVAAFETDATAGAAGTPRYMAPEQLRGEAVDRRADVWAVGAVLYEMLAGRPPFDGSDREAVLRSIGAGGLPAIGRAIPASLSAILSRALAHDAVDRFPAAAELAGALRRSLQRRSTDRAQARPLAVLGIAALAVSTVLLVRATSRRAAEARLDVNAVAILPFRVSGDASVQYLREGMVDLLAAKLTGEGGLRALDPRAVRSASRRIAGADADLTGDPALAVAGSVGAGNVLLGDVVATAGTIVINTAILDARGRVTARASVPGPAEQLPELVDRLVAQLLSLSAGEEPQRVAALTSTSLPALRAYLEGQAAYRRGEYEAALARYGSAVELDSTFALAGLGLELAGGWVGGVEQIRTRGRDIAWRNRNRLAGADRALLEALLGPDYPRRSTVRQRLDAVERGLRFAPERIELWYLQGDELLHHGRVLGVPDWAERAEAGFRRAIELDSTFAAPLHHLVVLHARRLEVEKLEQAVSVQLSREPEGATADFIRWRGAVTGALDGPAPPLDSMSVETLGWVSLIAQDDGVALADGRRAVELQLERPGTRDERFVRLLGLHAYALNSGHPREALSVTEALRDVQPDPTFHLRLRILGALYAEGDTAAAARAARELDLSPARDPVTRRLDTCVRDQWLLAHGQATTVPRVRTADPEPPMAVVLCEAVVDAWREADQLQRAGPAIAHLDSILVDGPYDLHIGDGHLEYVNTALARIHVRAGDRARALDVIARRIYFLGPQATLATSLDEEARLSESLGDTARAVRALAHHLALREAPDSALMPQTRDVRMRLARMRQGES